MRLLLLVTAVTLATVATAQQQQQQQQNNNNAGGGGVGLINQFRNFFRPRRQNQGGPPQGFNQQGQGQFQQQQQPQFQQPQQQFQPQQQQDFQNNQRQNNNQIQGFRPQQQQQQQPQQQNSFSSPPQRQNQQQTTFSNNNNINSSPSISSTTFKKCHVETDAEPFCPSAEPNHFHNGKRYLLTWNITCTNCECAKFTGDQAAAYCKAQGAQAVSLDTKDKADHFAGVSAQWAQRYYWTGGRIQYPKEELVWPSGITETWVKGQGFWSHTGGANDKGPQPDNRNQIQDGCEPEFCVGVLNNFYADGIKWHDIACHHKKPTICEFP